MNTCTLLEREAMNRHPNPNPIPVELALCHALIEFSRAFQLPGGPSINIEATDLPAEKRLHVFPVL